MTPNIFVGCNKVYKSGVRACPNPQQRVTLGLYNAQQNELLAAGNDIGLSGDTCDPYL